MIFHSHKWIYGNSKRKCENCGKIQVANKRFDGYSFEYRWEDLSKYILCPHCDGNGKVLNNKFDILECETCKGSGKIKIYD